MEIEFPSAIGHRHHGLARIGPTLTTVTAGARGQVLACLAPVPPTRHPRQRGPGVTCLVLPGW
jgi:hypothetical protein